MNMDEVKKMIETVTSYTISNCILLDYTAWPTALESPGKYFMVVPNNLQKTVAGWDI